MRSSPPMLTAAAAGLVFVRVAAAAGSPFRGRDIDGSWRAPRETHAALVATPLAFMPQLGMPGAPPAPATTVPATLADRSGGGGGGKRALTDNTCGYIDGFSENSLSCSATAHCIVNNINSHVGCCPDSMSNACSIATVCLAASQSSQFTTDDGFTLLCDDATYSECLTHYYVDTLYSGFTLLGCGRTKGVDNVYYLSTTPSATASRTSTRSASARASATESGSASETTDSGTTTVTAAPSSGGGKSNTGAIVGGVVGGVGGIAILGLLAFFLIRRRKNSTVNNAIPPVAGPGPAPGGPVPSGPPGAPLYHPGQPPMAQSHNSFYGAPAGAPGVPYDPYMQPQQQQQQQQQALNQQYTGGSGSMFMSSPSTQQTAFDKQTPSPFQGQTPPGQAQAYNPAPPAPGMGYTSGPVPGTLTELPTERGHGNVQELA